MLKNLFYTLFAILSFSATTQAANFNPEGAPGTAVVGQTLNLTFTCKDFINGTPPNNFYVPFANPSTITVNVTGGTPATQTITISTSPVYAISFNVTVTGIPFSVDLSSSQTGPSISTYTYAPVVFPIELSRFEGAHANGAVNLNWATETESNNEKFVVERSFNGHDFTAIGEIAGAGNSIATKEYNFTDKSANASLNTIAYYRLKSIAYDGQSEVSKQIGVKLRSDKGSSFTTIIPRNSSIAFEVAESGDVEIAIVDMNGQVIAQNSYFAEKGSNQVNFDFSNFNTGLYIATLKTATSKAAQKFVF